MSAKCRLGALGLGAAVLFVSLGCQCLFLIPWPPADPLCDEAPYSPPPSDFSQQDLVGSWRTQYGRSVDTLTIRGDGTFKQQYQDGYDAQYVYETPWSPWWLEPFADGRVRLHLQGARYYVDGIRIAELDGYSSQADTLPQWFYDPFTDQYLEMVGELILNVRLDSSGELLLHHMTPGGDSGGFALTGCQRHQFRRVETP